MIVWTSVRLLNLYQFCVAKEVFMVVSDFFQLSYNKPNILLLSSFFIPMHVYLNIDFETFLFSFIKGFFTFF